MHMYVYSYEGITSTRFTSSNIVITYGMAWHGFITTLHYLYIVYDAIHRMALIP